MGVGAPIPVATLLFRFAASTQNLVANVATAKSAMRSLVGSVMNVKAALFVGLTAVGIVAVVAFRKALTAFAAVDAGLREISTLLPITAEGIRVIANELTRISARSGEAPEVLTDAFYQSASAGFTDLADSLYITETAAYAAKAGLTDTATAMDAITTVLRAYGLEASEAGRVSDILFTTVQDGKVKFADLAKNIGTVAKTADLLEVPIEQVAALIAAVTSQTGQVEESFTAINRALIGFAKNTDDARAFAKKLGVDMSAAAIASKGLPAVLHEISEAAGENIDALVKLAPNFRQFRGLAIAVSKEGLEQFDKTLVKANASLGTTFKQFLKMKGALQNQKQLLSQNVNRLWLLLGEEILPKVVGALEQVNYLLTTDTERAILQLRMLGREEEALALIRKQLIGDFTQGVADGYERIGEGADKAQWQIQQVLGEEGLDQSWKTLIYGKPTFSPILGNLQSIEQYISAINDDSRSDDERKIAAEKLLIQLKKAEGRETGDIREKVRQAIIEVEKLASIWGDIKLDRQTIASLEAGDPLPSVDGGGGGVTPEDEADEEARLKRLRDARTLIDEIDTDVRDLAFFGVGPFDEIPGLVKEWKDELDGVVGQIDELIAAEEILAEVGDERSERAREYIEQLKLVRQAILDQRQPLADSLEFIGQFGEEVAELFGAISDEDRGRFAAYLGIMEKQLGDIERAKADVAATDDGSEAQAKAQAELEKQQIKLLKTYKLTVAALQAMGLASEELKLAMELLNAALEEAGVGGGDGSGEPPLATDWKKVGKQIRDSARAVLTLADAFDLLNDTSRKVLNGFIEIGSAVQSFASGQFFTGGLQAFAGITSILSGLTESKTDPAEVARLEALTRNLEHNSDSLRRLTDKIDDLAQFVGEVPGGIVAGFADTIQPILDAYGEKYRDLVREFGADPDDPTSQIDPSRAQEFIDRGRALRSAETAAVVAALGELGISIGDIEDIASAGQFEVDNLVKVMSGVPYTTQEAVNAFLELETVMEALAKISFDALFAGFEGLQRQIDLEEQLSDKVDPEARLERLVDLFDEMTDLPDEFQQRLDAIDFDNLDATQLGDLESLLNDLFLAVLNDPALLGSLGKFNPEDWINALTSLTDVVDGLQKTSEEAADEGEDTSFQVFRGITELTGNRIAGLLATDTHWNRMTALNTAEINAALGGEPVQVEGGGELQANAQMAEMIRVLTTIAINSNQLRTIAMYAREIAIRLSGMGDADIDKINRTAIVRAIQNQQLESRIDYDTAPLAQAVEGLALNVDLRPLADSVKGLRIEPQPITDIQSLVEAIETLVIKPETIADIRPLIRAIADIEIRPQEVDSEGMIRALERVEIAPQPITDISSLIDAIRGLVIEPEILNDPTSLAEAIEALTIEPMIVTDVQPLVDAVSGIEVNAQLTTEVAPLVHAIRNLRIEPQPITDFGDLIDSLEKVTIRPETIANFQPLVDAMRNVEIETQLITDVRPIVDAILGLDIQNEVTVNIDPLVDAIRGLTITPRFIVNTEPFADALQRLESDIRTALDVSRIVDAIMEIRLDPSSVIDVTPLADAISTFEIDPTNVFSPDEIVQAIEAIEIQSYAEIDTRAIVDALEAIKIEDTSEVDLSPLTDALAAININVNPVLDAEPIVTALREFALRLAEIVNTDEVVKQISEIELVHTTQFDMRPLVNAIQEAVENKPPILDSGPLVDAIQGLRIEPRYVIDAAPLVDAIKRVNITPEALLDAESIVRAIHALEIEPRLVVDAAPIVEAVSGIQVDPNLTVNVEPIQRTIRDLLTSLRITADPSRTIEAIRELDIRPSYETDITPIVEAIRGITVAAPTIDLTPLSEVLLGVSDTLLAVADPSGLIEAVRGLEVKLEANIDTTTISEAIEAITASLPDPTPLIQAVRELEIRPSVIMDIEPIADAIRAAITEPDWVIPISSFIDQLRAGAIAQPVQPPEEQMLNAFLAAAQFAQPVIGTVNIEIDVAYNGEDVEAASEFGATLGGSVMEEIDRQMADRYVQETRATGSATKRTA